MAKQITIEVVDKVAVEKRLYDKKARKLEWDGDKLVAVVFADGTRLEGSDLKVK